ncbi:hypothetical protein [Legionella nautarum]|nr:hypothetical protein [Legionella nautarum]
MNRKQFIKNLVSQFEEQISNLPDNKLEELGSGKLEISLTQAVGHEAGGALVSAAAAKSSLGSAVTASAAPTTSTVRTDSLRRR